MFTPERVRDGHSTNQPAQVERNLRSTRPALPPPEDSPAEPMPSHDRRRAHIDHCIGPVEESGQQRETDSGRVIHAFGFDAPLDIYCASCLRRTRFSARIEVDERKNSTVVRNYSCCAFHWRHSTELRARWRSIERIFVVQPGQNRFSQHERTRRQPMPGLRLRNLHGLRRRIRHT